MRGLSAVSKEPLLGVGRAASVFLSAEPRANARGWTASLALIGNEAQDIRSDRWDSVFMPMTAATNAGMILSGTPWRDKRTLLTRELPRAERDGRLIRVAWPEIADELPAYGDHVKRQIAVLGAQHPYIRSEYGVELSVERRCAGGRTWEWTNIPPI